MTGCNVQLDLQDSDLQYSAAEENPDQLPEPGYYTISKVLQFSDEYSNGFDIKPYFDWFDSFSIEITSEDGKISGIKIDNGDIPHNRYGFTLPASETECFFDDSQSPYCIRRTSDNQQLVVFSGAHLWFDFTLADKGLTYRYILDATNKPKEK